MKPGELWPDFEAWKEYGIEKKYESINPTSLKKSKKESERSWFGLGRRNGWLGHFNFTYKTKTTAFNDLSSWHKFGQDHKYVSRIKTSMAQSHDAIERSWYSKGYYEGWLDKFKFKSSTYNKGILCKLLFTFK